MIIFGIRAHYSAIGGVENSIRSLVSEASKRNMPSTLVCGEPFDHESLGCGSIAALDNVDVITYRDDVFFTLVRRLASIMRGGVTLKYVYKDLYRNYPDAIVIVRHHSHVLAAKNAGFSNIRYLVPSLSKDQLAEEMKKCSWATQLKLLCHAIIDSCVQRSALRHSRVFVFSSFMSNRVKDILPIYAQKWPIKIVKPGIDNNRFSYAAKVEKLDCRIGLQLPVDKTLILFVGRLVNAKGLDYFIDSIARSSKSYMGVIVGIGEQEPSLRLKIKAMGAEKRFIFAGARSDVESFYKACDVFVMSSLYEPLGQTIIEATSCGLPVVAFGDHPNVRTATRELGLNFAITYAKKLDSFSLLEALKIAATSYDSRKKIANSRASRTLFSWSVLLDELIA